MTEVKVYKYLYDWLTNLNLGVVFFNQLNMDSTNKKGLDRFVEIYLPSGIVDKGAFATANATIAFGVRDKVKGLPRMEVFDEMVKTLKPQFPYNKDGYFFSNFEYDSIEFDGMENHFVYYNFTIIVNGETENF